MHSAQISKPGRSQAPSQWVPKRLVAEDSPHSDNVPFSPDATIPLKCVQSQRLKKTRPLSPSPSLTSFSIVHTSESRNHSILMSGWHCWLTNMHTSVQKPSLLLSPPLSSLSPLLPHYLFKPSLISPFCHKMEMWSLKTQKSNFLKENPKILACYFEFCKINF